MSQRKIIHIDMDCFYAAVEIRDRPELSGLPVGVGGKASGRGVLCTANYEARKFGVRSAMPAATALRKCPDLVLLPVDMAKYRDISVNIQAMFREYTDLVEPLSLDEAFLDVSECDAQEGIATRIAAEIRQRIFAEHQLTASAGISVNKFIAKVASDWNKPNGQYVVPPAKVDDFVTALPVNKLFGVGKVTANKLHGMGAQTCGDLRQFSEQELSLHMGTFGTRLYQLCRGVDERPVKTNRRRKSLSVETTFSSDHGQLEELQPVLTNLLDELETRFGKQRSRYGINGVFLKLKFHDFQQTTIAHGGRYFWDKALLHREYTALLAEAWQRGNKAVRLLGLGLQFVTLDEAAEQLDFFSADLESA